MWGGRDCLWKEPMSLKSKLELRSDFAKTPRYKTFAIMVQQSSERESKAKRFPPLIPDDLC